MSEWLHDLDSQTRQTFECQTCLERGLEEARNCDGQYPDKAATARFNLWGHQMTQCPVSMSKPWTQDAMRVVGYCESGMGGLAHLPVPGGVLDQAADFYRARSLVLTERSRIQGERDRQKAPKKRG